MVSLDVTVGSPVWKDAIWLVAVFAKYGRCEEVVVDVEYIEIWNKQE
jgi:hypothetical protein